jgi:isocitrate/isopropylmalate dehydrogenase
LPRIETSRLAGLGGAIGCGRGSMVVSDEVEGRKRTQSHRNTSQLLATIRKAIDVIINSRPCDNLDAFYGFSWLER